MKEPYGRELDLNLLRVFVVVAELGSVTAAARELYLTQPAVSAALRRLQTSLGGALFVRQGKGLTLTGRGQQLHVAIKPVLNALLEAALSPAAFDPQTSDHVLRIGLSDAMESWLLPQLLRQLERAAPRMRLVVHPVQFRTVGEALRSRTVDLAITVADELPASIRRKTLIRAGLVCVYDPAHAKLSRRPSERQYFAHDHVIVSYAGDLRGVVEDMLGKTRRVRCSLSSFHAVGPVVEGSALLATVPEPVASMILRDHPRLRSAPLPFRSGQGELELLWPSALEDDPAARFLRDTVTEVVHTLGGAQASRPAE